jgi:hypothetical protein
MKRSKKSGPAKPSPDRKAQGKKARRVAGVRETEEARALLEKQLHSLYWWVFQACRMKGFIRAKAMDELSAEKKAVVATSRARDLSMPDLSSAK